MPIIERITSLSGYKLLCGRGSHVYSSYRCAISHVPDAGPSVPLQLCGTQDNHGHRTRLPGPTAGLVRSRSQQVVGFK